jgi:3-oxoacyl-[acyl-carrier-protein] synthase-3
MGTVIKGLGAYLPEKVVTNDDLTQWMDTSDEWIVARTGIRERRWVEDETNSYMAEQASRQAVRDAGLSLDEVECIIVASLSPDHDFPGVGCFLQNRLGLAGIPAMDIRCQCSGFIYSLSVADAWIKTRQYKNVLLVGSEIHSTGLDLSTKGRDVTCLFGDAAAALLLEHCDAPGRGILSSHLHADGKYAKSLWLEAPGSTLRPRLSEQHVKEGRHFPKMNGRHVFTQASLKMPEVIREALSANGLSIEDIDLFVPHQANLNIINQAAKILGLPDEKVFSNIEKYGNTTAASIPLGLLEAKKRNRLSTGDTVVLASFGAGFTWASAVLIW